MSDEELRTAVEKVVRETLPAVGVSSTEAEVAALRMTDSAIANIQVLRQAFNFRLEVYLGDLGVSPEVAAEIKARISQPLIQLTDKVSDAIAASVLNAAMDALVTGALAMRAS